MWLDFAFHELFGLDVRLSEETADLYFDTIAEKLQTPEFLPRALYERFNIEVLATTDSPLDPLNDHEAIRESGWKARIVPTFRPDSVVDPDFAGFRENIEKLGVQNGEDSTTWLGYLEALRKARARFRSLGCTATDHGHPTAQTADLDARQAEELFHRVLAGHGDAQQHELFRAQMLTEMAAMSLEDGLVMQIHPGSVRNHNRKVFAATWAPIFPGRRIMWMRCVRCSTALATSARSRSFFSRWTKPHTAANSRRLRATIPACGSGHRGGFTIALKE
jgi:glucuronate isomerase